MSTPRLYHAKHLIGFQTLGSVLLIFFAVSCKDQIGNPPTPPSTGSGTGQIVYNSLNLGASNPLASAEILLTDSSGAAPHEVPASASNRLNRGTTSLVISCGRGRFAWVCADTGGPGGQIYVTDNTSLVSSCVYSSTSDSLNCFPVLSSDGTRLALLFRERDSALPSGSRALVVYTLGTDHDTIAAIEPHVITKSAEDVLQPCFSPDGSRIAFYGNAGSSSSLEIANTDGTGQRTLLVIGDTNVPEENVDLGALIAWSPSGDEIAFRSGAALKVIRADGTGLGTVDDSGATPEWSPDGKTLAYTRAPGSMSGSRIVLTSDFGITKRTLQPTNQLPCALPRWSPDGRRMLAVVVDESNSNVSSIEVIDLATNLARVLATPAYGGVWLR